jgi:hypothetical protein
MDRDRQRLGVVTVGTDSKHANLRKLIFQDGLHLAALCHRQMLRPEEPELPIPTEEPKRPRIGRKLTPEDWTRHTIGTFSFPFSAQPDANYPAPADRAR